MMVNRFGLLIGLVLVSAAGVLFFLPAQLAEVTQQAFTAKPGSFPPTDEEERRQNLDWQTEIVLGRLKVKEEVIQELIAGRMTFLQAAACFCQLNTQPPGFRTIYAPTSGTTVEERNCRQVINWVKAKLSRDGAHSDLVPRLEQELEQLLHQPGGIDLPPYNP
jgi:hypothetical protein